MTRLIYAVPADLNAEAAHCVHVVKMGHALREAGAAVEIVVLDAPAADEIATRFALQGPLPVRSTGFGRFGPVSVHFARAVLGLARSRDRVFSRSLPTACLAALLGRPTILELHSPVTSLRGRIMFRIFVRSPGMLAFVTITHALKERYLADFGDWLAPRIEVLPDAADPVAEAVPGDGGQATVGYVGGFLPGKGVDLVLQIAERLPAVRFDVVGGSTADLDVARVPPNVTLPGRLPHAEAMARLAGYDVVLLPNQESVMVSNGTADIGPWTSPLKMFEYMAAGKAIVASRLPVLQEVLVEGRNCLLAEPTSVEEWSARITQLLADRALAQRLGHTAREEFLASYTWSSRARRILGLFESRRRS